MAVRSTQKRALTPKETKAQQNWRLASLRRAGLPVPPRGQRTKYKPEYVDQAKKLCGMGATDAEIAHFFNVSVPTLSSWAVIHEDFGAALQEGGAVADERVKRSLYERAVGYSYDSEKIIYDAKRGEVIRVPIRRPRTRTCASMARSRTQPRPERSGSEAVGRWQRATVLL
jgi:hypothetical protein